jgi:hypothetical protein
VPDASTETAAPNESFQQRLERTRAYRREGESIRSVLEERREELVSGGGSSMRRLSSRRQSAGAERRPMTPSSYLTQTTLRGDIHYTPQANHWGMFGDFANADEEVLAQAAFVNCAQATAAMRFTNAVPRITAPYQRAWPVRLVNSFAGGDVRVAPRRATSALAVSRREGPVEIAWAVQMALLLTSHGLARSVVTGTG